MLPAATTYPLTPRPDGTAVPGGGPWPGRAFDLGWRCAECPLPMRPVYALIASGAMACDWHGRYAEAVAVLGWVELDRLAMHILAEPVYLKGPPDRPKRVLPAREARRPKGRHPQHEQIVEYLLAEVAFAKARGLPSPFTPGRRPGGSSRRGRALVAARRASRPAAPAPPAGRLFD